MVCTREKRLYERQQAWLSLDLKSQDGPRNSRLERPRIGPLVVADYLEPYGD